MTALPGKMAYKQVDGLIVAEAGPVAIEGVLHRVEHGFVVCYPEAKDCQIHRYSIQGELFEEYA